MIDYSASDDYADLTLLGYTFYYGYEETIPADAYERELEEYDWAFVVERDGKELYRCSPRDFQRYMSVRDFDRLYGDGCCPEEPYVILMVGIAIFFDYLQAELLPNGD